MTFQLVERTVPAGLVAAAGLLVVQARMGEGELGAFGDGAKIDLDERLAGILAARPAPAHRQPIGSDDLQIFAAALMLSAVEHAEAYPIAAADPHIGRGGNTGPSSGPHQQAMPSGVVSASKTIDGRALMRRTSVRLVIHPSPAFRLLCPRHRPRADRGSPTRSARSGAANPWLL